MTKLARRRIRTSACERTTPSAAPAPASGRTGASSHLARTRRLEASSLFLDPGNATPCVSPADPPGIDKSQGSCRVS